MTTSAQVSKYSNDPFGEPGNSLEPISVPAANSESPKEAPDVTTQILRFLSAASAETIGGIVVALAASTYLILGRLGLILIGILGGVVLHATWEGQSSLAGKTTEDARRERGLEILNRILDLRSTVCAIGGEDDIRHNQIEYGFEGFRPETASALNDLVDAIIRDYVKWWYHPVLPSEQSFPTVSRQTLTKFISSVAQHLSRKRPADTLLDLLTNSSSIIIVFLNELSSALSLSQGSNIAAAEAVRSYLSANPDSNLANVLNERQQSKKFKMVADDILRNFLEKSAYDCEPAKVFLREIIAGVALEMTLKSCSKAEWLNGWIVYLLEDGEPDISQAIDAGMSSSASSNFNLPYSDIDGNVGNIGLAKPQNSGSSTEEKGHKKRLSKAEEAMKEAILEAKRLSELIAQDDEMRMKMKPVDGSKDVPKIPLSGGQGRATSIEIGVRIANGVSDQLSLDLHSESRPQRSASNEARVAPSTIPQQPETAVANSPTLAEKGSPFTSFDQLIPQAVPVALQGESTATRDKIEALTLQNANIIIHDDSNTADKGRIWTKPNGDYLVQIEPESSHHPGWMIVRRYPDFETLHEVLRRIATISDAKAFAEQHPTLPNWKEHTKPSLRGELERYLREACWHKVLAESEGMKRFLEKDRGQSQSSKPSGNSFSGIGWPTPSAFETMGKGMLDVLTSAPKGAAESSKVVLGGVTGVFQGIGTIGHKKSNASSSYIETPSSVRSSTSALPRVDSMSSLSGSRKGRLSDDSLRATPLVHTQPPKILPMERRPSYNPITEDENENERQPRVSTSARSSMSGRRSANHSRDPSRVPSRKGTPLSSPTQENTGEFRLPPTPSDIPDEFAPPSEASSATQSRRGSSTPTARTSTSTASGRPSLSATRRISAQVPRKLIKDVIPLSEQETRVAVELLFAVVNELYTLSSAWNIRRTLLTAAKTFLLRPGNPSLSSIQSLIQDSIIASNTSDTGIASHLRKLRENALPTEDELNLWPAGLSAEEKEELRVKARRLLVERGVPTALTGVMGQAATGEAIGRVFDCLQVEEVLRGLMFGLLLQGVRAVTQ